MKLHSCTSVDPSTFLPVTRYTWLYEAGDKVRCIRNYEGTPDFPTVGEVYEVCEDSQSEHYVTVFFSDGAGLCKTANLYTSRFEPFDPNYPSEDQFAWAVL